VPEKYRLPAWAGADKKYLPGGACREKGGLL